MLECTVSQEHKKLLSEMTFQRRGEIVNVIIIYEDYGGGHRVGVGAYILIFSKETSFTLEYGNSSIGGSERKQHCL